MQFRGGIRLSGLNKGAMIEKKKEIADQGKYDLMINNCAQQVARIAEAGLGCNIRDIPFLLPDAIELVGAEIGRALTPEELKAIQTTTDEFPEDSFLTQVTRRLIKFVLGGRRNLFDKCED